jgi:acetyl esterase/lipase
MPSWQARVSNAVVRVLVRRENWGNERQLARRARRIFGAPRVVQWLHARGLRVEKVNDASVHGEWIAAAASRAATILFVHGGGFVSCSATTHRPITAALARRTRARVFSVEYRRAPEHKFPAALEDAARTYRWLLDSGTDARTLALAGDSAGGGLVLSLLVFARDAGWPLPACAVCFSPWADLTASGSSHHGNDGRCAMFRPRNARDFAAAYLANTPAETPLASPLFAELGGLPPVLLQVGSTELLLDDARGIHDRIQRANGSSTLEVFDDVHHGWQMMAGLVPEADVALDAAALFISRHVG